MADHDTPATVPLGLALAQLPLEAPERERTKSAAASISPILSM